MANGNQCYGHVSQCGPRFVGRRSKVDIVLGWPVRSGLSMLGRHLRTQSGNISRCFKQKLTVFSQTLFKIHKIPSLLKVTRNKSMSSKVTSFWFFSKNISPKSELYSASGWPHSTDVVAHGSLAQPTFPSSLGLKTQLKKENHLKRSEDNDSISNLFFQKRGSFWTM